MKRRLEKQPVIARWGVDVSYTSAHVNMVPASIIWIA